MLVGTVNVDQEQTLPVLVPSPNTYVREGGEDAPGVGSDGGGGGSDGGGGCSGAVSAVMDTEAQYSPLLTRMPTTYMPAALTVKLEDQGAAPAGCAAVMYAPPPLCAGMRRTVALSSTAPRMV